MNGYFLIKTLHILSATVLFGTGLGIAFFMLRSYFSKDIQVKLYASETTVVADSVFTLPAVILQPATGIWLLGHSGYDWTQWWLVVSYILYLIAGACWLPVVWIQIQLKKILITSVKEQSFLPSRYFELFRIWFVLGWPAFLSLVAIFYLMATKPI